MAQFIPKSRRFKQYWEEAMSLATKVLRDIEERWLRSDEPFPVRQSVSVFLRIATFDFYATAFITYRGTPVKDLWNRSVDEWLSIVHSPEVEARGLAPRHGDADCNQLVEALCEILASAEASWQVAPEVPRPDVVVKQMADELFANGFVVMRHD